MNPERLAQLFFDDACVALPEQQARRLLNALPHARGFAGRVVDGMAAAHLVAVIESMCVRELQPHLDPQEDAVVAAQIDCRHCALLAPGSRIRITGWVERLDPREVTFRVAAQDRREQVCEGRVRLAIVARDQVSRVLLRKQEEEARAALMEAA
jgi:predicted thioesterase